MLASQETDTSLKKCTVSNLGKLSNVVEGLYTMADHFTPAVHHSPSLCAQDPDAPSRQGRNLADLDAKDEESLVKHLFACVRAGQLARAQELCVKYGQPWRASALEGWRLSHDPNYGKSKLVLLDPAPPPSPNNVFFNELTLTHFQ